MVQQPTQTMPSQAQTPQAVTQSTTQQTTQQPAKVSGQPAATPGQNPIQTEKKSIFKKWWFWLIIVAILIALGVGAWLLFF